MKFNDGSKGGQTLKAEEFMGILQVSPNTFKKLVAEGRLPSPLPLGKRNRRWSRDAVEKFLNNPGQNNTQKHTDI